GAGDHGRRVHRQQHGRDPGRRQRRARYRAAPRHQPAPRRQRARHLRLRAAGAAALRGPAAARRIAGGGVSVRPRRQRLVLLAAGAGGIRLQGVAPAARPGGRASGGDRRAASAAAAPGMKKAPAGAFSDAIAAALQSRDCSLASRRRNSMYSHTRVTISPNAPYHSMYFGAPCSTPLSMKSKSSTRFSAAITITNRLKPMPTMPLSWIIGMSLPNIRSTMVAR